MCLRTADQCGGWGQCGLALNVNISVWPDISEKPGGDRVYLDDYNARSGQQAWNAGKQLNGVLITQHSLTVQLLSFNVMPGSNLEVYFYCVHGLLLAFWAQFSYRHINVCFLIQNQTVTQNRGGRGNTFSEIMWSWTWKQPVKYVLATCSNKILLYYYSKWSFSILCTPTGQNQWRRPQTLSGRNTEFAWFAPN